MEEEIIEFPGLMSRPAEPEDEEAIFLLNRALIDRYESVETIPYEKVLDWVRREIRNHLGEYRVLFWQGEKTGYYRFHQEGAEMELSDLYILPKWQGKGMGTAVLAHCIAQTNLPISLYVFVRNTGAFRLYTRMGFSIYQQASTRYRMRREASAL